MAQDDELSYNSLQVLSQARRVSNSPLSLNDTTDSNCKLKNCTNQNHLLKWIRIKSSSNSHNESESHYDYKSGAVYEGILIDNHKYGQGTFIWPNGDKYIGEFKLNYRHGFGTQLWNDGSIYEGNFLEDKRSGQGLHKWTNGDSYDGSWLMDYRHGSGKYKSKESNLYDGMFFMNHREGYGSLMYSSGNMYMGLYKKDKRYGPGLLKYPNNTNDVGYWNGDKLIRLLVSVDINFNYNDLDPIEKLIELKSWYDRENLLYDNLNPQNIFTNKIFTNKANKFIKTDPYMDKVLEQKVMFLSEFLKEFEKYLHVNSTSFDKLQYKQNRIVEIVNLTESLKEIFKYFKRYQFYSKYVKNKINIDPEDFETNNRNKFQLPGLIETNSIELLNACSERNLDKIKMLKNSINLDVCDNRGYSPIIIAILRCDSQIINYLLDNGANINHLLDNGLSGLMICMIRYYTSDKFLPNSALKHQDLTITRKITPNSLVVPTQDEVNSNENHIKLENFDDMNTVIGESTKPSEFDSDNSLIRYKIDINDDLVDKYADLMSKNERVDSYKTNSNRLLKKTTQFHFLNELSEIIDLLLRRGADPSLSYIPYPALCFAVAAGDIKVVRNLLEKGADCNKRMPKKYCSLTPLCLACGVMGESGPELVKLLLDSLADPNASSDIGNEYLSMCEDGWKNETVSDEISNLVVGRTPLHIACSRNDPYAAKVIKLLLDHSANPNIICNGQSPLSLAIASGNKEAVDLLLKSNLCDPNLPLSNGIGSALCVISSTLYEHNWLPNERIKLIDKLIHYGADILQPIAFGPRRYVGTVVDYAYYMYNSDNRLAHTPYHSLTINERNAHNARKNLLNHLAFRFREKALERAHLLSKGIDIYPPNRKIWGPAIRGKRGDDILSNDNEANKTDKRLSKWCYNCGRSVGIKLLPCSRCKKVYYCSNNCKQKAWIEIHKDECELPESLKKKKKKIQTDDNFDKYGPPLQSDTNNDKSEKSSKVKDILKKGMPLPEKFYFKSTSRLSYFEHQDQDADSELSKYLDYRNRSSNRQAKSGKERDISYSGNKDRNFYFGSQKISLNPDFNGPDNYSYN